MRVVLMLVCLLAIGCGKSGPTYEQAAAVYQAELAALERLEKERDEVEHNYQRGRDVVAEQESADQLATNAGVELDAERQRESKDFERFVNEELKPQLDDLDRRLDEQRDRLKKAEELKNRLAPS